MAYATTNPYTGETLKVFPDATDQEVQAALDGAYAAFLNWRETSFAERAKVMTAAATILRDNLDEYARLLTLEMGKLLTEARAEVILSAEIFEYYAEHAERLLKAKPCRSRTLKKAKPYWCMSRRVLFWPSNPGTSLTTRSPASSRRSFRLATRFCSSTLPTCRSALPFSMI